MAAIGFSAIFIGDIPSGQPRITYFGKLRDSGIDHEQPQPGDRLRQCGPFHRPLRDADFRGRRHHHGPGARHGLFGTAAVRHPGLRRLRGRLADHRLARRPLEPPPHDGDLLCRHRRLDDRGRLRADAAATRRGAAGDRPVRLDLPSGRHRDDRVLCRQARPRDGPERRLGQPRRGVVGAGHRRDRAIFRLALGLRRAGHRHHPDRRGLCPDGGARGPHRLQAGGGAGAHRQAGHVAGDAGPVDRGDRDLHHLQRHHGGDAEAVRRAARRPDQQPGACSASSRPASMSSAR